MSNALVQACWRLDCDRLPKTIMVLMASFSKEENINQLTIDEIASSLRINSRTVSYQLRNLFKQKAIKRSINDEQTKIVLTPELFESNYDPVLKIKSGE